MAGFIQQVSREVMVGHRFMRSPGYRHCRVQPLSRVSPDVTFGAGGRQTLAQQIQAGLDALRVAFDRGPGWLRMGPGSSWWRVGWDGAGCSAPSSLCTVREWLWKPSERPSMTMQVPGVGSRAIRAARVLSRRAMHQEYCATSREKSVAAAGACFHAWRTVVSIRSQGRSRRKARYPT